MTLYQRIVPYFNNQVHVYGCNLIISWPPLKNRTPNFYCSNWQLWKPSFKILAKDSGPTTAGYTARTRGPCSYLS